MIEIRKENKTRINKNEELVTPSSISSILRPIKNRFNNAIGVPIATLNPFVPAEERMRPVDLKLKIDLSFEYFFLAKINK